MAAQPVLPGNSSSANPTKPSKSRTKQPVLRKSTRKSPAVQTAIIAKRVQGASVAQIARDLDISRNTVTSIVELSTVEQQIEQYRKDAVALAPLAIKAVSNQIESGDGDLGLRLLDRIGVIGEDAIDTVRRNSHRQHNAINVLVQPGATVTVQAGDGHSTVPQQVGDQYSKHNVSLSDTHTMDCGGATIGNNDTGIVQVSNGTGSSKTTDNERAGQSQTPAPTGEAPKSRSPTSADADGRG